MKKQYDELFAANEKEKKKRQRSKKRIQHNGGITGEEAQELIRSRDETTVQSVPQVQSIPSADSFCKVVAFFLFGFSGGVHMTR